MSRLPFTAFVLALVSTSAPVHAIPSGEICTMPTGRYLCKKPGDVTGLVTVRIPEGDFRILASSSYAVDGKRGSYLLTGDHMVMTGGPFEGRAFQRISVGYLRQLGTDGQPGDVRCVLTARGIR